MINVVYNEFVSAVKITSINLCFLFINIISKEAFSLRSKTHTRKTTTSEKLIERQITSHDNLSNKTRNRVVIVQPIDDLCKSPFTLGMRQYGDELHFRPQALTRHSLTPPHPPGITTPQSIHFCYCGEENGMQWYNEPKQWRIDQGAIHVVADAKTDFWRTTHYGFIRDNGHFYAQEMSGNFRCSVRVQGMYRQQYDQAGLIVWHTPTTWIKTGIEYVDGMQYLSAVVTRDFSDWSVVPLASPPPSLALQLTRHGDAIEIQYAVEDGAWAMLRLAYFSPHVPVQVGIMCAAPDGDGFPVAFSDFTIQATD
jgi:hypothetical protein